MTKATSFGFTLGELATQVGAQVDAAHAGLSIVGINTIECAIEGEICFVDNTKYLKKLSDSKASAVLILEGMNHQSDCVPVIVENPKWAFAKIIALFYPNKVQPSGIHPTVIVGQNTVIDPSASIGPHCVLGDFVSIEAGVCLGAHVVVGDHCHIGKNTFLHPNVSLYANVTLGADCIIHSGVILGSDGFGFAQHQQTWVKIPHIGGLKIGNGVEIGANTSIDRGLMTDTVIQDGVIIDNLVHIAHNVQIGAYTAIAACVGIAGSAKIGQYCQIGGGSLINGHITIADYTYFIAGSQVASSIKKSGLYASAIPAKEYARWVKNVARFHQLDEMASRLKSLENKLKAENL